MTPQLSLGSAQFGMNYGVTNKTGRIEEGAVTRILEKANMAGIRNIDTAQGYGKAEEVIGRSMKNWKKFKVTSKLAAQIKTSFGPEDISDWEESFMRSCKLLGVSEIDSYLLHSAEDLKKPGWIHLATWLHSLRERKLVRRVGVSIYEADDLKRIDKEFLDVVQLPLSLFDQRLIDDGTISKLRENGTRIQARSVYLQGLLLTKAKDWPKWMSHEVRAHQKALEEHAEEKNLSLLELALGFAKEQKEIEEVVVGVCSVNELEELVEAWKAVSPWGNGDWRTWRIRELGILDPRCWPR